MSHGDHPEWWQSYDRYPEEDHWRQQLELEERRWEETMNIDDAFPSAFLKADDLKKSDGTYARIQLHIHRVVMEVLQGEEQAKPIMSFIGKEKRLVLNRTNASIIAHLYTSETDHWQGKPIILYVEHVPFKGNIVPAIRVQIQQAPVQQPVPSSTGPIPSHTGPPSPPDEFEDDIPF